MANLGALLSGSSGTVQVDVTHSGLKRRFPQLRFDLHDSVESVKEQLQQRTGSAVASMQLHLYNAADKLVAGPLDDSRPLGFYSVSDGYRIHIVDLDPTSIASKGWLEDTSLVQKYTISDEKYDQLDDSARKFKAKLFEMRPDLIPAKEFSPEYMGDLAAGISVGSRCEVSPGSRRGEVKFVGHVKELNPGYWVGVAFDEPYGKHDGRLEGSRYFQCPPSHGVFLRPDRVEVGDFPERDPFADDEPDEL